MAEQHIDNRFIIYDGYNISDVEEWLMERRFETATTHRNANVVAYPFGRTSEITVIRPREYVYFVKGKIKTISTHTLVQKFLSAVNADNHSDFDIKMNLKLASIIYRKKKQF